MPYIHLHVSLHLFTFVSAHLYSSMELSESAVPLARDRLKERNSSGAALHKRLLAARPSISSPRINDRANDYSETQFAAHPWSKCFGNDENDSATAARKIHKRLDTELYASPRLRLQGPPLKIPKAYISALMTSTTLAACRDTKSPAEGDRVHKTPPGTYNPCAAEILPWLFLGSKYDAQDDVFLQTRNIRFVLNVSRKENLYHSAKPNYLNDIEFKFIYTRDSVEDSIIEKLCEAFEFIEKAKSRQQNILIHCSHGVSRSVSIVAAYLIKEYKYSLDLVMDIIKAKRPIASPNLGFIAQLQLFQKAVGATHHDIAAASL